MRRLVPIAVVVMILAGCSTTGDYSTESAADLQKRVLSVSDAVSTGDYTGASTQLADLTVAANDALANGGITKARHDSIAAAAALVQSDVDAAIAAAEAQAAAEAEKQRLAAEEAARKAAENTKGDDNGKHKKG